jgi:hypothetical protein
MKLKEVVEKASKQQRLDFKIVKELFDSKNYILLIEENDYENANQSLEFICKKHRNKGKQYTTYNNAKFNKHVCDYCAGEEVSKRQRFPFRFIEILFNSRNLILLDNDYISTSTPMKCICIYHPNKIQYIRPANLIQHQGCRYCGIEKRTGKGSGKWNPNLTNDSSPVPTSS